MKKPCMACSQGKLITKPSVQKTIHAIPKILEHLNADVWGPIDPQSGPFRYFLFIVDSSTKWLQVSLLSTQNLVFARILANILKLKAQFPESPIRRLRVDGTGEFTSKAFDDFCWTAGIDTEYPVPYVHFQNGIAELVIKHIHIITRPLLMNSNLPTSAWGYAVLHATTLLKYRPSAHNTQTPYHLAFGLPPDLSHLRIFGCQVMVPILGPKQTKLGPQQQEGIYVGNDSTSIIRYLDPTTGDLYKARYQDCHFYEETFPKLLGDKTIQQDLSSKALNWNSQNLLNQDPRTRQADEEVRRILHLNEMLEKIPDAFNDAANVTRSRVEAANAPARHNQLQNLHQRPHQNLKEVDHPALPILAPASNVHNRYSRKQHSP
jgi:hypothetical protein